MKMYRLDTLMMRPVRIEIRKVIYNPPATIVFWSDDTKTVVKCAAGNEFDPEKGLAMAYAKKAEENKDGFYKAYLKKWLPENDGQYAKPKVGKKEPGWVKIWPGDYSMREYMCDKSRIDIIRIIGKDGTIIEGPCRDLDVKIDNEFLGFHSILLNLTAHIGDLRVNIDLDPNKIISVEVKLKEPDK